jgi:hypothetical protein
MNLKMLLYKITPRNLNLYRRLSIRYMIRNRGNLLEQTFEIINENGVNEILSYMKYNHITDDTFNSYMYIIIYEIFQLSIMMNFINEDKHSSIIKKSIHHVLLYIMFKEFVFPIALNMTS